MQVSPTKESTVTALTSHDSYASNDSSATITPTPYFLDMNTSSYVEAHQVAMAITSTARWIFQAFNTNAQDLTLELFDGLKTVLINLLTAVPPAYDPKSCSLHNVQNGVNIGFKKPMATSLDVTNEVYSLSERGSVFVAVDIYFLSWNLLNMATILLLSAMLLLCSLVEMNAR